MKLEDFKILDNFMGNDKYFYIVVIRGKNLEHLDLRISLSKVIKSLPKEKYISVDIGLSRYNNVSFQNIREKNRHNGIVIRNDTLVYCLGKIGISLIDCLKMKLVFSKTRDELYAQRNRLAAKYSNKKKFPKSSKKDVVTTKCHSRRIFGEKVNSNYVDWIEKNRVKLENNSTKSEDALAKRLFKTFKKRVKIQQPFVINGHLYFADICLKSKKAIVEVDGGYHNTPEQHAKDAQRDKDFASIGYKTIRIKNEDVRRRAKVKEVIDQINSTN